jgi:hypothetical protein
VQYRLALRQAEQAGRLAPRRAKYQAALGAAQYRLGCYPDAAAALAEADRLEGGTPAALAFLAMTEYRLYRPNQAEANLVRLRELLKRPPRAGEEEARALFAEAEYLLRGRRDEGQATEAAGAKPGPGP